MTPEELAEQIKNMIAKDDWTSHIKVYDSAILQLATLMLKHDPQLGNAVMEIRFYMFGYLTGQLQQKWKDEGLENLTQDDIEQWEQYNQKRARKAAANQRYNARHQND